MVKTYLKTLWRMFERHITRLISIILMVVVSVGLTAGIGMATDKINDSLAEYYDDRNVSDIILMNEEGAFTEEDISLMTDRYGEENVTVGGLIEFEVKDGKAEVDGFELTFTGVPDGIVRVYIFDGGSPEDLTQNKPENIVKYDTSANPDALTVYAERPSNQLASYEEGATFTLSTVINTTQKITQDTPIGPMELDADLTLNVNQSYVLGGTLLNPLHMATRDDPSYTDDPASDDENDMLDLTAIFYVFGNLIDTTADGTATVTMGENTFTQEISDQAVTIGAQELKNQAYIRFNTQDALFSLGYDGALDNEVAALKSMTFSADTEILTLHENFSFESFREYANKILGIGYVMMVVFLFVTVLVVLSTMTRLLDEERGQIACLMTLGYSPSLIIFKYLLFAAIGTLIGGFAAYFAGLGLSWIIYINFEWNFVLPPYSANVVMVFYTITFAIILVSTLVATIIAGYRLTSQPPAELLRPKAPKAGKTVFLEKMPLIWNRLSFKYKSTMRNVLRFFVRFLMTVVAVAFSTALVLAGLAVLDCCLFQDIGGAAMIGVAIIVLVFAALLNFVVIYTLTNINISERERELATLMVLGYHDGEVAGYIFREIYITSFIGILFGLPLGCLLCLLIFKVMGFGSIAGMNWFVWVLAIVLSVVFTILVTLMLRRKIVKIDMNNSLKAIE